MEMNPTIELSDEENVGDDNIMPPPAFIPTTKPAKEKKAPVEKKIRSTRSKQTKRTKVFNCIFSFQYFA